jgi:hypothetical protein
MLIRPLVLSSQMLVVMIFLFINRHYLIENVLHRLTTLLASQCLKVKTADVAQAMGLFQVKS